MGEATSIQEKAFFFLYTLIGRDPWTALSTMNSVLGHFSWTRMVFCDPMWFIVVHFGPLWAIIYGPSWSSLVHYGQLCSIEI